MKKIAFLLLIGSAIIGHADSDWQLEKNKDEIVIYSAPKAGQKLKQYKAEFQINKDADTILAALQDTAACSEWVYNCVTNDMVGMSDVSTRLYHTVIHSPLWFKDRDFYLQSQVVYDSTEKLFTISFVAKPEHAETSKDQVRISDVEMTWQLKYLAKDQTLVIYQVYIDPKLPIKAINHAMIEKSIFQTMLGLRMLVEKPIYATKKYSKAELDMLTESM